MYVPFPSAGRPPQESLYSSQVLQEGMIYGRTKISKSLEDSTCNEGKIEGIGII